MGVAESDHVQIRAAAELGRVCAAAARGQRDLQVCAQEYAELFPPQPFDPTLLATVAQANAFSAPWLDPDALRLVNRASLWGFAVDWRIDYLASSGSEVEQVVRRCLAVADGATPAPDDPLTRLLAAIRDELAGTGRLARLRPLWREELRRMLAAMAREWDWRDASRGGGPLPTFDDYIDNADNLGSSFVDISHWIFTSPSAGPEDADLVTTATREQQKVLRLLNDLASYGRDIDWGDLNALRLGLTRAQVTNRIAVLVDHCVRRTDALRARQQELATFLERQIGFCMAFYQSTDYWGTL